MLQLEFGEVTTGVLRDDPNLNARIDTEIADLVNTNLFNDVKFHSLGARDIHRLHSQIKNAIVREFLFEKKSDVA